MFSMHNLYDFQEYIASFLRISEKKKKRWNWIWFRTNSEDGIWRMYWFKDMEKQILSFPRLVIK